MDESWCVEVCSHENGEVAEIIRCDSERQAAVIAFSVNNFLDHDKFYTVEARLPRTGPAILAALRAMPPESWPVIAQGIEGVSDLTADDVIAYLKGDG